MSYSESYRNVSSFFSLVHAFATSKMDNCNSLLARLLQYLLDKVQRVHNTAALLVSRACKYDSITTVKELHWLRVKERMIFKIFALYL